MGLFSSIGKALGGIVKTVGGAVKSLGSVASKALPVLGGVLPGAGFLGGVLGKIVTTGKKVLDTVNNVKTTVDQAGGLGPAVDQFNTAVDNKKKLEDSAAAMGKWLPIVGVGGLLAWSMSHKKGRR